VNRHNMALPTDNPGQQSFNISMKNADSNMINFHYIMLNIKFHFFKRQ
jgi:hypothetical protein